MPEKKEKHKGYLSTVFGCYCPRCREGKLFQHRLGFKLKKIMLMNKYCPVCGQPTEIEVGFYYGTSYVSYVMTILLSVISFFLWWIIIGMSLEDNRFFYWIGFNAILLILLQPWLMRLSRSFWISWFVKYDPDWEKNKLDDFERIVPEQMNNW
jgi:uncharacterized protein (DUF983 family)